MRTAPGGLAPLTTIVGILLVSVSALTETFVIPRLAGSDGAVDDDTLLLSHVIDSLRGAGAFVLAVGVVMLLWSVLESRART